MKKTANLLISVLFSAFIFAAMLTALVKPKTGYWYYENRSAAPFPALTGDSLAGGDFFDGLEKYLADQAAFRQTALKIKTWSALYLLKRPVVNKVVITDSVLLPHLSYMHFDSAAVTAQAESFAAETAELQRLVESYGGAYYYVGVPCQYSYYEGRYPWFLENRAQYTETVLSAFSAAAGRLGVNYLDMRLEAKELTGPGEFSSAIDNHFSLKGAYFTYLTLRDALFRRYGLDLVFPEEGDIRFQALPNPYLGSRTRQLLDLYPGHEQLYTASFAAPVPFKRFDNGAEVPPAVYALPHTPEEPLLYNFYMGGDIGETVIATERPELPDALIYGDSFTNALECLMYYSFDEMRSIDLRHYASRPLSEYIRQYQPDLVICIRDHEALIAPAGNGDPFGLH